MIGTTRKKIIDTRFFSQKISSAPFLTMQRRQYYPGEAAGIHRGSPYNGPIQNRPAQYLYHPGYPPANGQHSLNPGQRPSHYQQPFAHDQPRAQRVASAGNKSNYDNRVNNNVNVKHDNNNPNKNSVNESSLSKLERESTGDTDALDTDMEEMLQDAEKWAGNQGLSVIKVRTVSLLSLS